MYHDISNSEIFCTDLPDHYTVNDLITEVREIALEFDLGSPKHVAFSLREDSVIILEEEEMYKHLGSLLNDHSLDNHAKEIVKENYDNFYKKM